MSQIRLREGTIHRVCTELDCSRDALARRLDMSSTALFRIDSDRVSPGTKFIARLITVTGESFDDLFELTEDAEQVPA